MKIASIVGTRPNFIKIAALVGEIKKHSEIQHRLIHTGQHYDEKMSDLFFNELGIPRPDTNLEVGSSTNENIMEEMKTKLKNEFKKIKPDLVIVVGDVNSTLAGAEAAHELGIRLAHVEAGLRSFDNTMPEEFNRVQTDKISDFLFTTEKSGNKNLLKEGISKDKVFFVGNVMIDTLIKHREKAKKSDILKRHSLKEKNYCVLTLHRPSNVDKKEDFENIISIIKKIQEKFTIVFPIHPRTRKNLEHHKINIKKENLKILNPLGYLDFLCLMSNSKFVLTDSGGIQEETTVLGVPCITLRKNTERPVTVKQGTNLLVSIDKEKVVNKAMKIIDNKMDIKNKIPEKWDGKAAKRIINILLK